MDKQYNVPVQSLIDHIKTALDVDPWAKKMAEDLLSKCIPVGAILIREGRNKNYNYYECPKCGNEVVYEQNYCSWCGVQFLWR